MTAARSSLATWARRIGLVLAAGLVYLVVSIWDRDALMRWIEHASPTRFFIAMAILPTIGVPITPFFLLAGTTFGIALGLVGSLVALFAQLLIAHWIATSRLRRTLATILQRFDYELPDFEGRSRNALRFSLMVKLTPGVPNVVKNYLLASSGVPFGIFVLVSMVVTGVYGAALVVLGESLFQHRSLRAILAVAVVAALGYALVRWLRQTRGTSDAPPRR
ncbi:MAG: hypothetical protein KIT31_07085 [Deltaproteobacteria bacterium]|nr:hypothetical protein [Deltaproteobacteria bacterium]